MKLNLIAVATTLFVAGTSASTLSTRSVVWWAQMPECGLKCLFDSAEKVGCDVSDVKCLCTTLRRFQLVFQECADITKCTKVEYERALKVINSVPCAAETVGPGPVTTFAPL
ncbi:hypothetical protein CVT24_012172 [Panaeolus cyanescens]|uniref:CFEM domain-containing protein n=1 Tax=Panaeolus cyanescens TaxID=181874 RepID=A0A409YIX2_9AGAR|nr:hypothetical protein CVT24_012172 [Panaeolus cyanescens]